jgi:hypothetical protein
VYTVLITSFVSLFAQKNIISCLIYGGDFTVFSCDILYGLNGIFKTNPLLFKMNFKEVGWEGVDCGSEYGPVAGYCEH